MQRQPRDCFRVPSLSPPADKYRQPGGTPQANSLSQITSTHRQAQDQRRHPEAAGHRIGPASASIGDTGGLPRGDETSGSRRGLDDRSDQEGEAPTSHQGILGVSILFTFQPPWLVPPKLVNTIVNQPAPSKWQTWGDATDWHDLVLP